MIQPQQAYLPGFESPQAHAKANSVPLLTLSDYDHIIVYFSGGVDSLACILYLLENYPEVRHKVEVWHHEVDGREGSRLMDWPVTPSYVKAVAEALALPLYFSWRVGGFEGEMNRVNAPTGAVAFEVPGGSLVRVGGESKQLGTRLKFPQVSADLKTRYCSSALKIDVAACAIRNQARFDQAKILTISGERREESPNRAKYAAFEADRTDNRQGKSICRHVDRWRPVIEWSKAEVWQIIKHWSLTPHPCYYLVSRASCMNCIFLNHDAWATLAAISPEKVQRLITYEEAFGYTMHRQFSLKERIARGQIAPSVFDHPDKVRLALSQHFDAPVFLPPDEWQLPPKALSTETCGPS